MSPIEPREVNLDLRRAYNSEIGKNNHWQAQSKTHEEVRAPPKCPYNNASIFEFHAFLINLPALKAPALLINQSMDPRKYAVRNRARPS